MKILETPKSKALKSKDFNLYFDKETGYTETWGKTKKDDPEFCQYGPIIADIEISTQCSGTNGKLCSYCVIPSTNILKNRQSEIILNIKEGDLVKSFNLNHNSIVTNRVLKMYEKYYDGELICIELLNSIILKITPEHEVYTNSGWKYARDLTEQDKILYEMQE